MRIPAAILTLLAGMALVLTGLWVGQNINLLPEDASLNAPVYDELFKVLFSIGTILLIGIAGLIVYSLVRFRRVNGDHGDGVAIEGNLPLEILWTAIPAIVVLFVGIYSYDIYERMGADANEPTLPVEVTAMQFAFIFHYPEADITSGELHVPVGQPVALTMKANDVIHAFWVPQFRLKQDIIPGQPTLLSFTATKAGRYPIVCAELCGPYHGGMRSTVIVDEPQTFADWVAQNSPAPAPAAPTAIQS